LPKICAIKTSNVPRVVLTGSIWPPGLIASILPSLGHSFDP